MKTVAITPQPAGSLISRETIREIASGIAEVFSPEKIVLFGSYASGDPTPDSDLDLLIVMGTDQPRHKRGVPVRLLFRPMPCAMDLFVYTLAEVAEWNGTVNHIVTKALQKGEILYARE